MKGEVNKRNIEDISTRVRIDIGAAGVIYGQKRLMCTTKGVCL